jgi:hypothetical protein
MLDSGVVSSGAPGEQLDLKAALDQGRRMFSLQARYQDGDYELAGPLGVSSQPLRDAFAVLPVDPRDRGRSPTEASARLRS